MARRPVLSNYPHLRDILRKDPQANRDFQLAISSLGAPNQEPEEPESISQLRRDNHSIVERLSKEQRANVKLMRFIRLLGEVIEPQVELRPYSQDLYDDRRYTINFSANQIRLALKLYWDDIANSTELAVAQSMGLGDPADEREADDDDDNL